MLFHQTWILVLTVISLNLMRQILYRFYRRQRSDSDSEDKIPLTELRQRLRDKRSRERAESSAPYVSNTTNTDMYNSLSSDNDISMNAVQKATKRKKGKRRKFKLCYCSF